MVGAAKLIKIGKVILIFLIINIFLYANDEKVSAILSKSEIYIDETFTLSIIIEGISASTNPPEIENLTHIGTSQKKEINYIGGIKSTKTIYSYMYQAEATGSYLINAIPVRIKGQTYYTEPINLKVSDRPLVQSQNSNSQNNLLGNILSFMDGDSNTIDKSVFLHSQLSKTNVYVYEPIYFEQSIYIKNNTQADIVDIDIGNKNVFWIKNDDNQYAPRYESLNNELYFIRLLNREVLFPILEGKHNVVENTYVLDVSTKSIGFSDRIKKGGKNLTINVVPLPTENKPKNFSGGVGNFDFAVSVNTDEANIGEAFLLKVIVWGEGTTDTIKLPDIREMLLEKYSNTSLDIYSPREYLTNEIRGGRIYSEKIIEYMIVVNDDDKNIPSKIEIDPLSFSFFSLRNNDYITLNSERIYLNVNSDNLVNTNILNKNNIRNENIEKQVYQNEIMPIKTGFIKLNDKFVFPNMFIFIYLSISIFIILIIFLLKRFIVPYFFNNKEQTKNLSFDNAIEYLNNNDIKNYIKEIEKIFYENISNILSKDITSKSSMEEAFQANNIDIDIQNKSIKIIDKCHYFLYSPIEDKNIKSYNYHDEMKRIIDAINHNL